MNKKLSLPALALAALALLAGAPAVQAQCTGGYCTLGACPWYNHIADGTFSYRCPNAWEYQGMAGVTTSNMCGWSGNSVGYLSRNTYVSAGIIRQAFIASSSLGDVYSFEYFIQTTSMQPGDIVRVYIVDVTTSQSYLVDTITTNLSCAKRTHTYTNPGWKGHFMNVRFEGSFASTAASAHIDYVAFWQRTY